MKATPDGNRSLNAEQQSANPAEEQRTSAADHKHRNQFNVLSFVAGLVFMVGGLSFLGQQNRWFTIDLGTVLPIVAIVGGLAAIFGTRRNE
jgi:Flp pilus assembly protein TadB